MHQSENTKTKAIQDGDCSKASDNQTYWQSTITSISAPHLIDSPNYKYQNMRMWIYFLFLLVMYFVSTCMCVYICM